MRALVPASLLCLLVAACAAPPAAPAGAGADTAPVDLPSQVPPGIEERLQAIGHGIELGQTLPLYAPLHAREPYAGVRVTRAERYGPDPERNVLDVFVPEAPSSRPRAVLVFVHGGGFTNGARRRGDSFFYDHVALWAAHHGMVGVTTTYRLAPAHPWPAAQEDLAGTVAWLRANIGAQGGDPSRIYLFGHSAGAAHVAQYLGHPELQPGGQPGVAGAILLSGLYDPATESQDPGRDAYFGTDRAALARRDAVPGLAASRVPLLLAWAELDPDDFATQAAELHQALCQAGRCGRALRLMGHSHLSEIFAVDTPDTAFTDAMQAFIRP